MSRLSLVAIMQSDPEFGKRISRKVQEIKQDKKNILNAADEYGKRYEEEIIEGTKKRAKLLTEGQERGLTEEQVFQSYGRFIPTVYTPILNFFIFYVAGDRRYGPRQV